ncbi:hypothetical protein FB451DRAFT_1560841 [Mycena latifolia]|nr:hypothetical protein FB451DRAFT_1560841 [Mycena latifolia]
MWHVAVFTCVSLARLAASITGYLHLLLLYPTAREAHDAGMYLLMQTSYAFGGPGGAVEARKLLQRFRQFLAEQERFWRALVKRVQRARSPPLLRSRRSSSVHDLGLVVNNFSRGLHFKGRVDEAVKQAIIKWLLPEWSRTSLTFFSYPLLRDPFTVLVETAAVAPEMLRHVLILAYYACLTRTLGRRAHKDIFGDVRMFFMSVVRHSPVFEHTATLVFETFGEARIEKLLYAFTLPFLRRAAILCRSVLPDVAGGGQKYTLQNALSGWCAHYGHYAESQLNCGVVLDFPAVYRLARLPLVLDNVFGAQDCALTCQRCSAVPVDAAICLLCGTTCCMQSDCCRDEVNDRGECNLHMRECGGAVGWGMLLYIYTNNGTFSPPPYLDAHGEVDISMSESRLKTFLEITEASSLDLPSLLRALVLSPPSDGFDLEQLAKLPGCPNLTTLQLSARGKPGASQLQALLETQLAFLARCPSLSLFEVICTRDTISVRTIADVFASLPSLQAFRLTGPLTITPADLPSTLPFPAQLHRLDISVVDGAGLVFAWFLSLPVLPTLKSLTLNKFDDAVTQDPSLVEYFRRAGPGFVFLSLQPVWEDDEPSGILKYATKLRDLQLQFQEAFKVPRILATLPSSNLETITIHLVGWSPSPEDCRLIDEALAHPRLSGLKKFSFEGLRGGILYDIYARIPLANARGILTE